MCSLKVDLGLQNLNLPFIEATRRGRNTAGAYADFTAATPPISAYRKFYAPVDPREQAPLPRAMSLYSKGEGGYTRLPARGHAFRREGEERRNKRNGERAARSFSGCVTAA